MEFTIEFYETENGNSPVQDFLDDMKRQDDKEFAALVAKMDKLKHAQYHREPHTKTMGDGLLELRHIGRLNTRVLWFYVSGRRIIAVHGIRNKAQKIRKQDKETALDRKRDWEKRYR